MLHFCKNKNSFLEIDKCEGKKLHFHFTLRELLILILETLFLVALFKKLPLINRNKKSYSKENNTYL